MAHRGEDLITVGNGRAGLPPDGRERWSARGVTFQPAAVAVAGDGLLFASSPGAGGGEVEVPGWSDLIRDHDANADGALASGEVPETVGIHLRKEVPRDVPGNFLAIRILLGFADKDKDGTTTQAEWDTFGHEGRQPEQTSSPCAREARGDTTETHLAWKGLRGIPERCRLRCSTVAASGSCVTGGWSPATKPRQAGVMLNPQRLGVGGQYASSPVGAAASLHRQRGRDDHGLRSRDSLEVLSRNDLTERILATPALDRGHPYVRTEKHLWAFR